MKHEMLPTLNRGMDVCVFKKSQSINYQIIFPLILKQNKIKKNALCSKRIVPAVVL